MRIDELLKTMLQSFFIIVAGIVASIYVFCLIFNRDATFSLDDIGRILIMALASDLPYVIFLSRKELSKKQMFIRLAIHLPILIIILLYLAQAWDWIALNDIGEVAVFLFTVVSVYAVVLAISAFKDKKLTDRLNSRLKERYHS